MLIKKSCAYAKADGQPCRMAPLRDRPYCFSHDPERAADAAEARRLGGAWRRKEGTIAVAYDLPGLDSVAGIRRVLEIATFDLFGLENSIARARTLISAATAAMKLLETGELEARLAVLELASWLGPRQPHTGSSRRLAARRMTTAASRRMAKLEGALMPREAVLAWLVEAQQFPSLEDHVRSIVELPVEAAPLSVIGDRVEAAVRASMKGQPREAIETAVRRAIRDGVFLFTLAIGLNVVALEMARLEGLRATATFYWMGCLLGGPRPADLPPAEANVYERELADSWALWWPVVDRLSLEGRVENEARATLERRYFGGHDVFFADAGQAWASHVDMVERLLGLAETMASTGGPMARSRRSIRTAPGGSLTERVAERVAALADDARVRAYEIVGDRPRAVQILERRLLAD